ncbi:AraC family transcriptional regulator [Parendozoicomonas sp. Alg238-R29]|uniref:AraC family transcriptional regulator n=1 Tax=Parendozoicomonas sp. Alg238-R29 TaxID=2993446 RepID=UPI00248DC579|nr:AraC family transcriptional regulator [Parendozoicomonas sp. Alg238-R29]
MDILISSDPARRKCSCQNWRIQLSGQMVNMGLTCPVHENGCWQQFHCYLMDTLLLANVEYSGVLTGVNSAGVYFKAKDFFVVYIPVQGSISLQNEKKDYIIKPGDIGVFHTEASSNAMMDNAFSGVVMAIPATLLLQENVAQESLSSMVISADSGAAQLVAQMACSLPAVLRCEGSMSRRRELSQHLLGLLRMSLQTEYELSSDTTPRQKVHLGRIFQELNECLGDPDLDLESLANKVHLSASYVSRLLGIHGSSFREELRSRRLQRVAQALSDPFQKNTSVTLLAMENGFCNSSAFSRTFFKQYGLSPRDYRKQHAIAENVSRNLHHEPFSPQA